LAALVGLVAALAWLPLTPPEPGAALWQKFGSVRIVDRHGAVLQAVTGPLHTRARPVPLAQISPWLVQATLTLEDRRFWSHPGIDPLAAGRAAWGNLRAGRVTSGASTLTQQLTKWLQQTESAPRRRTLATKLAEAAAALQLEARFGKDQILSWYLNFAPYGGLLRGAEQASRSYFAKPASALTPAEAAWLAVVARAPGRLNPLRYPEAARPEQQRLLAAMHKAGLLTEAELQLALAQPLTLARDASRAPAPHFAAFVAEQLAARTDPAAGQAPDFAQIPLALHTTLVAGVQQEVQRLTRIHVERSRSRGVGNAAVVVLDLASAEVVALVGSADATDAAALGANNGALALRQPGSTLKPFAYAAAFDAGRDPATLLQDSPGSFATPQGLWQPGNYGDRFAGPVLARTALASSLNLAAVRLVADTGLAQFHQLLLALGLTSLGRHVSHYGLALVLGDGEVDLLALTGAFATLGRSGQYLPPRWLAAVDTPTGRQTVATVPAKQVLSPRAAWWTADILADPAARSFGFGRDGPLELPFWTAIKTGTSKGFRDNWTVAVTDRFAVGVWVGHFDGAPMPGVSGVTGAAPLARDVLMFLHKDRPSKPPVRPADLRAQPICAESGASPGPHCPHQRHEWLASGPRPTCSLHPPTPQPTATQPTAQTALAKDGPVITSPAPGTIVVLDSLLQPHEQQLALAATGNAPLRWTLAQGQQVTVHSGQRWLWTPSPGRHTLTVTDSAGRSSKVEVEVRQPAAGPPP
jgi:penicillin-binding protein 1C